MRSVRKAAKKPRRPLSKREPLEQEDRSIPAQLPPFMAHMLHQVLNVNPQQIARMPAISLQPSVQEFLAPLAGNMLHGGEAMRLQAYERGLSNHAMRTRAENPLNGRCSPSLIMETIQTFVECVKQVPAEDWRKRYTKVCNAAIWTQSHATRITPYSFIGTALRR